MRIISKVDSRNRTGLQPIAFMSANPAPTVETAMEVLVRLELVIDVGNQRRGEACRFQRIGHCYVFGEERMPAADLHLIVALQNQVRRKDAASGIETPPRREGG